MFHAMTAAISLLFWGLCSAALTMYNRWLLYHRSFRFPISLTCLHSMSNFLLARTYLSLNGRRAHVPSWREYAIDYWPVGVLQSCSIVLRNSAALHSSVSNLQQISGYAPLLVYTFSIALGLESLSKKKVSSLLFVLVGVSAASIGEFFVRPRGLVLQLAGLTCETMKSTWLKRNLVSGGKALDLVETLSLLSPIILISTLPVALVYESDSMLRFVVHDPTVMIELCGNIALAVVLNLAYLHSVKTCKVTTCAVATVIKDCFLVYVSPFVFGSSVQYSSAFYGLAVIGILQYMGIGNVR